MAAVLRVPAIFICENNQWALSTPNAKEFAAESIADRAVGYGIPGVTVDGNDVLAVYRATKEAVDRARAGGGPTLIEAKTMRMKGHSAIDPAGYVPPEHLEQWAARDPIQQFETRLRAQDVLDDEMRTEIEARIDREVDQGVEWAEAQPEPEPGDVYTDVFASVGGDHG